MKQCTLVWFLVGFSSLATIGLLIALVVVLADTGVTIN